MRFIILSIALLSISLVNSCGDGSQDAAIEPDPVTVADPLPTSTPIQTVAETPVTTVSPVNSPTPVIESSNTHTVRVIHHEYVPRDLTIKQGDTVEWIMVNAGHTVTSGED